MVAVNAHLFFWFKICTQIVDMHLNINEILITNLYSFYLSASINNSGNQTQQFQKAESEK